MNCCACDKVIKENQCKIEKYPKLSNPTHPIVNFEQIIFCQSCGLGRAKPDYTDQDLWKIYEQGNYWQSKDVKIFYPRLYPGHWVLAQARWELLQQYLGENSQELRILDIGAGHGFLGMVAADSISEYAVIESDPICAQSLFQTFKKLYPNIKVRLYSQISEVKDSYDVVVFSHVLEHVNNPEQLISSTYKLLKSKGLIFIDVPNQDYKFRNSVFPHVLFFNQRSLRDLVMRNDYELLKVGVFGRDFHDSPLNEIRINKLSKLTETIIFKLRSILPIVFMEAFYKVYFGSHNEHPQGTWLRLIAKMKERI